MAGIADLMRDYESAPMNDIEALAYDRSTGWGRGRVIHPRGRLYGFWLRIAQAIGAGFNTEAAIAFRLRRPEGEIARAVAPMVRHGYLREVGAQLVLAKHTRRQVAEGGRS